MARRRRSRRAGEIAREEGAANTVQGLRELARYGEAKGVTVCMEHLNTRDDSHPMKGHPGYQGDDIDYCADIIRQVGSPRAKLLFDIYHVAIMNGDIIRRLRQYHDLLGHIHTAGVPGRAELDECQEIHYPAIMRTLVDIGYTGYVGQEFIPTRDPAAGAAQAIALVRRVSDRLLHRDAKPLPLLQSRRARRHQRVIHRLLRIEPDAVFHDRGQLPADRVEPHGGRVLDAVTDGHDLSGRNRLVAYRHHAEDGRGGPHLDFERRLVAVAVLAFGDQPIGGVLPAAPPRSSAPARASDVSTGGSSRTALALRTP